MGFLAFAVGSFLGGLLAVVILTYLVERFAFRGRPPEQRALATVGVAWLLVAFVAGWGFANGGSFRWDAGLYYLPSAIAYWAFYRKRLWAAWEDNSDADIFA